MKRAKGCNCEGGEGGRGGGGGRIVVEAFTKFQLGAPLVNTHLMIFKLSPLFNRVRVRADLPLRKKHNILDAYFDMDHQYLIVIKLRQIIITH